MLNLKIWPYSAWCGVWCYQNADAAYQVFLQRSHTWVTWTAEQCPAIQYTVQILSQLWCENTRWRVSCGTKIRAPASHLARHNMKDKYNCDHPSLQVPLSYCQTMTTSPTYHIFSTARRWQGGVILLDTQSHSATTRYDSRIMFSKLCSLNNFWKFHFLVPPSKGGKRKNLISNFAKDFFWCF